MDVTGTVFAGLTMASIITMSGITINLTENFGSLAINEQVKQQTTGPKLVGSYGNAVTGMSAVVIGLSALYIAFFIYGLYKKRFQQVSKIQKVYWVVMMLAVVMGISAAGVNLNLTENYQNIDNLEPDPNPVIPGENYKLRGVYGTATLGVNIASLGLAGVAFLWMTGLFVYRVKKHNDLEGHYDPVDYKLSKMQWQRGVR